MFFEGDDLPLFSLGAPYLYALWLNVH